MAWLDEGAAGTEDEDFARRWGLPAQETSELLGGVAPEVRAKILRDFNGGGTKDGNVFGRLQAFAGSLQHKWGGAPLEARSAPPRQPQQQWRQQPPQRWAAQPAAGGEQADPYEYSRIIGLGEEEAGLVAGLPWDVSEAVVRQFDPSTSRDGNVFGRLVGFARSVWAQKLGLNAAQKQEAVQIMRGLGEAAQARVMAKFDVSGTKDGNVIARLQSFARSVALRHDSAGPGAASGGQPGAVWQAALGPPAEHHLASAAAQWAAPRRGASWQQPAWQHSAAGWQQPRAPGELARFADRLELDEGYRSFLQGLPEEVLASVVGSFDPAGTKDGNVWGRLFGFVRSVWTRTLGLDQGSVALLKSLPEEAQRTVMVKFDPSRTKDGNIAARLENFALQVAGGMRHAQGAGAGPQQRWPGGAADGAVGRRPSDGAALVAPARIRGVTPWLVPATSSSAEAAPPSAEEFVKRWGLNEKAARLLEALPQEVSSIVLGRFNAHGTKDGNVWGRLLGFVISVWIQKRGVDEAAATYLRGAHEEAQMAIISEYDPNNVVPGCSMRDAFECIAEVALDAARGTLQPAGTPAAEVAHDATEDVEAFVQRCGLDQSAADFLRELVPEVRAVILADFDPGGTKDGNVFRRLQGFARSLEGSRKRGGLSAPGSKRPRTGP